MGEVLDAMGNDRRPTHLLEDVVRCDSEDLAPVRGIVRLGHRDAEAVRPRPPDGELSRRTVLRQHIEGLRPVELEPLPTLPAISAQLVPPMDSPELEVLTARRRNHRLIEAVNGDPLRRVLEHGGMLIAIGDLSSVDAVDLRDCGTDIPVEELMKHAFRHTR